MNFFFIALNICINYVISTFVYLLFQKSTYETKTIPQTSNPSSPTPHGIPAQPKPKPQQFTCPQCGCLSGRPGYCGCGTRCTARGYYRMDD